MRTHHFFIVRDGNVHGYDDCVFVIWCVSFLFMSLAPAITLYFFNIMVIELHI